MNNLNIPVKQLGVTLIELLVVITTVGMLVILIANLPPAIGLIARSNHQSLANQIANKQIENLRGTSYENVVLGSNAIVDSRLKLLPLGVGTVNIDECDESICKNDEDMKKITVTLTWKDGSKDQKVVLETLVTNGGLK
jgi:type II secretory pathway pseudopilin PulG